MDRLALQLLASTAPLVRLASSEPCQPRKIKVHGMRVWISETGLDFKVNWRGACKRLPLLSIVCLKEGIQEEFGGLSGELAGGHRYAGGFCIS